jgi:mutator protein MutT
MPALSHALVLRDLPDDGRMIERAGAVEVVAGLIRDGAGRYLITRRQRGTHLEGLWEFPGGKREAGETLEQSLRRELHEELGAHFAIGDHVETVPWTYPEKTVILHFFQCRVETGTVEPCEGQQMEWVAPAELHRYDFPPADAGLLARLRTAG